MRKTILDCDTVTLDEENGALVIVDQTQLPNRIEMLSLTNIEDIWEAIYLLKVKRRTRDWCVCGNWSVPCCEGYSDERIWRAVHEAI